MLWHIHENEDEMFHVPEGIPDIYKVKKKITVNACEFSIVYLGTGHLAFPQEHVKLLLFEPAGIPHTAM